MTRRIVSNGLAPSLALAPSLSLAPMATIYAGGPIAPHVITMAVGVSGAYIDVSTYVEFGEGISYTYGRQTQFDDTSPGTFTFTLNNSDGRFTPDNAASPLATKVTEGMGVCWQLGTRLVRGTILAIEIPADEATWHHLVVTCDDMLGAAGRHALTSLADALVEHEGMQVLWKLDEPDGSDSSAETNNDGLGAFVLHASDPSSTTQAVTYGIQPVAGLPGSAITITAAPGETNWYGTPFNNTSLLSSVTSSALAAGVTGPKRYWNLWVYPGSTINLAVTPHFATGAGYSYSMQIQCTPTTIGVKAGLGTPFVHTLTSAEQLVPHYLSMQYRLVWQSASSTWALFLYLYIDAVYVGNAYWYDPVNNISVPATAGSLSPVVVNVSVTNPAGATANLSGTVQRVSHTTVFGLENNALYNSLDQRRAVLDFVSDELSSATYNGPLSASPIGYPDVNGATVLDVYNDIVRSEAGHLFCRTTGMVTSPVEQIQVRARDRPTNPAAVFDMTLEADGRPTFIRDRTNVARQTEVSGPTTSVTVTDTTITGRYIAAGTSEQVLYTSAEDLREWGQDRLYRGRNVAVRAQTFTIDAMTTPTDRSADLLALVPGDRIQLANVPTATLGFASWDGWLLGATESHSVSSHRFTFTLAPTIAAPAVYDTDLYANDGDVTLAAACTATDTTLTVTSATGQFMSTETPYTCKLGTAGEQITVTAVSGNTLTVSRGANGTTAIAHSTAAPIEPVPSGLYGY